MMTRDELEFQISQYLDGTLAEAERVALEDRLGGDADARALLAEYRDLDIALKATAAPLPAVRWDRLAEQIAQAVASEQIEQSQEEAEEVPAAVPLRGRSAAGSYRLAEWLRGSLAPLSALAASLLIVGGVGLALRNTDGGTETSVKPPPPPPEPIVIVKVTPEFRPLQPAPGEPVVAIGPSKTLADAPVFARFDLMDRPRRASIASGVTPAPDRSGSFLPN